MMRIELYHILILLDGIGDIGSLHFPFSRSIRWMDDVHYPTLTPTIFSDDLFRMFLCIRSSGLGGEQYGDIFSIGIYSFLYRHDILGYDIVWLGIYRYDDDMFEIFGSF